MRKVRVILHRLRSLLRRSQAEAELNRELDLHIEQLTKEHVAAGMAGPEARLTAQREFGSLEMTKELCRDMRRVNFVGDLVKDLAYSFRLFTRSPGFTLTAVLSLALGIGANTAIFSLVDAVLLRMLPVHEAQQLVEVSRDGGGTLSYPMYEMIRDRKVPRSSATNYGNGLSPATPRYWARRYWRATGCTPLSVSPLLASRG